MERFEYDVIELKGELDDVEILDYKGKDGWELVAVVPATLPFAKSGEQGFLGYLKKLSNVNRLDRFLSTRKAEILESIGDKTYMVISSSPAYLRDEVIFDIHDEKLCEMVLNPPSLKGAMGNISCGQPYPTINGLRADNRTPYGPGWDKPRDGDYLEIIRNGYIEYGKLISQRGEDLYLASRADFAYIVNFVRFIEKIYGIYLSTTPIVVNFAIYNTRGMYLAVSEFKADNELVKWQGQHLELERFYIENLVEEAKLLPKRINDRIWQAFHRRKATVFDDAGNIQIR
jgi:hypothetical protein